MCEGSTGLVADRLRVHSVSQKSERYDKITLSLPDHCEDIPSTETLDIHSLNEP